MILRAENLTKNYGEFRALHGVTLGVRAGEFVSTVSGGVRSRIHAADRLP